MRQVTLYTLEKQEVLVTSDYINFCSHAHKPIAVRGSDEFVVDSKVNIEHIPIERYVISHCESDKECLVAFDPDIRKLLGADTKALKDELREVKQQNANNLKANKSLVEYANHLSNEHELLVKKLNSYHSLTFLQRLIFLFTGVVKGDSK